MERTTRGIRNNNPGNIRKGTTFDGQLPLAEQTDKSFIRFKSMEYGLRAMFRLINTYGKKYGIYTIEGIISRWAPPSDGNNTEDYIEAVCNLAHFDRNLKIIQGMNSADFKTLVKAMCWVESQYLPSDEMLDDAYNMAFCFKS